MHERYNSGAKEVDDVRLDKIEVKYNGAVLRTTAFFTKVFNKDLLESIGEYHDDSLFYKHSPIIKSIPRFIYSWHYSSQWN